MPAAYWQAYWLATSGPSDKIPLLCASRRAIGASTRTNHHAIVRVPGSLGRCRVTTKSWIVGLSIMPAVLTGCGSSSCFMCKDGYTKKKDTAPLPAWQTAPATAKTTPVGGGGASLASTPKSTSPSPLSMTPAAAKAATRPEPTAPAPIQPVAAPSAPVALPSAPAVPATSLNVPPPPTLALPEPSAAAVEKPAKPLADSGPALPPFSPGSPAMLPPPPGAPSLDPAPLSIPSSPLR